MSTRRFAALCIFLACLTAVSAQTTVSGTVRDSLTKAGLGMASVTLLRHGKPLTFTKTDAKGRFHLKANSIEKDDRLSVSYLGYGKRVVPTGGAREVTVDMTQDEFKLEEVFVSGRPITNRADTMTYDLTRFADGRDNSLKDVLKKLPGVSVAKNGEVSVNGKAVSRFTVEGLDLTGGKYDKLNENIKAKDVKSADVIEHDQPVKALQGKVYSDNVAMNINLKDEARDKLLPTITTAALLRFPMKESTAGVKAHVMQIGKKRQLMYDMEYDHTGKDLSVSGNLLARMSMMTHEPETSMPQWFHTPSLSAPIDDERLRFNNSHDWNINRVRKNKRDGETRMSAGYLHTTERQTTSNVANYYLNEDTPATTSEEKRTHISSDRVYVDYDRNINEDKTYGNHYMRACVSQSRGNATLDTSSGKPLRQEVKTPEVSLLHSFGQTFANERFSLGISSVAEFLHSPSRLTVNGVEDKINTTVCYTNNSAKLTRNRSLTTSSVDAGFKAYYLNADGGNTRFSIYASPYHEIRRGIATWRFSVPVSWELYASRHRSFMDTSPNISLNVKKGNRSNMFAYVTASRTTGGLASFAMTRHRSDYRTVTVNDGTIPRTTVMASGLSYTYKRPITEFFCTLGANYSHAWLNTMSDMQIENGEYVYRIVERRSDNGTLNMNAGLSKGWFDLHLKAGLNVDYTDARGKQLSADRATGYRSSTVRMMPSLIFSPSWCQVSYYASFSASHTRTDDISLQTLWNWRQSLSLTATIGAVDLSLSGVHYHNELQSSPTLNTLLADASVVWRMKKVRLSAELRNMFDRREYIITSYGGVSSSTSRYQLRPREIYLTAQVSI